MIRIQSLTKRYGQHLALDHLTVSIQPGDLYGLIGPNGSGKSTTLRILTSLIQADSGTVQIMGQHPSKVLGKMGILFEYPHLYPYLSGWDHLVLWGSTNQRPSKSQVSEIAERIGLQASIRRPVKKYSLGMKQRLLIGAILLRNPQVYLLDEPTTGLDQEAIHYLHHLLKEEAARNKTVLITSHTLSDLQGVVNRIGILARGKLVVDERLDNLLHAKDQYSITFAAGKMEQAINFLHQHPHVRVLKHTGLTANIYLEQMEMEALLQALYQVQLIPIEFKRHSYTLEDIYTLHTGGSA
ncbi:ABC transporter ATP-binding protein [Tumebacillus lipolyticus]|uniref:ABC transporter ATP-binding protein n=1 Tax=Tumebacillus lipolyticus TaxID=1280370 RepID=A0ABW4ZZ88_9BACL